jgi:uncharacterized protein YbjT (DUF2867 family)
MKAFVAGSTGETGRRIVQELLKRSIPVKVLVRNLDTAKAIFPPEVELIVGDVLKPETFTRSLSDCTVLLSATGARPTFNPSAPFLVDYQGTKNLVDAAKIHGIQHFVLVSSLCVSKFFHPLNLFWLILLWKRQGEKYLQNSGLTYTIVRPGGLKNEDNSDRIIMSSADTLFQGSIPRQKVAQVAVTALIEPSSHNKIVEIIAQADADVKTFTELFSSVS